MQDDKDLSSLKALAEEMSEVRGFGPDDFERLRKLSFRALSLISRIESADLLGEHYEMLCQSKDARISELEAALQVYADPSNWRLDDNQIARVWHEPNSSSPEAYAGFEHATNVLAAQDEAEVASRCRAQGGNTSGKASSPSPAVDLSGLTRYAERADSVSKMPWMEATGDGEYVKLTDVQALLSSAASDVGGLTKLMDEAIADLSAFTEGSIRDFPSFREELESLSTNQHKPTLKLIRKSIYDTIDARVRNAVKAAQAAREVLATKEAHRPTDDALWDQTLCDRDTYHEWADKLAEAIAKHFDAEIGEHSSANCPWAEALEVIESATSPAPSVKQEAGDDSAIRKAAEKVIGYRDGELPWAGWLPDNRATRAALQELADALAAPTASQGEVKVPEGWREFIENIATPYSEPLNSICAYRDKASRKEMMGELRRKAQELLSAAPSVTDGEGRAPQGYKLVPLEADDDMISAACEAANLFRVDAMRAVEAAIAAAPAPTPAVKADGISGFYIEDNCGDTEI